MAPGRPTRTRRPAVTTSGCDALTASSSPEETQPVNRPLAALVSGDGPGRLPPGDPVCIRSIGGDSLHEFIGNRRCSFTSPRRSPRHAEPTSLRDGHRLGSHPGSAGQCRVRRSSRASANRLRQHPGSLNTSGSGLTLNLCGRRVASSHAERFVPQFNIGRLVVQDRHSTLGRPPQQRQYRRTSRAQLAGSSTLMMKMLPSTSLAT
jgi:hypothetical protein